MELSKFYYPIINTIAEYLMQLYANPIRTKSLACGLLSSLGNLIAQLIYRKSVREESLVAHGLFGLIFGGTIPHFFYKMLAALFSEPTTLNSVMRFVIERFIYAPVYQFFYLYMLARFEGMSHEKSLEQAKKLHWPVVQANWKFLSVIQLCSVALIPPVFRVVMSDIMSLIWSIYLSHTRQEEEGRKSIKRD